MHSLGPQDASSAPEGEYLATSGPATRRQASIDPEFHVVAVRGRPYLLPVLAQQSAPRGGKGKGKAYANELDLHRTSATVVSEMSNYYDPDAIECVRMPGQLVDAERRIHQGAPPPSQQQQPGASVLTDEFMVSSAFVGVILGKGGKTKERLEQETGATIEVPRGGDRGGAGAQVAIQLRAPSADALESATTRLTLLVGEAKERAPPTHFVSLPLCGAPMQARVRAFAEEALAQHAAGGLSAELVVPPARLHATLCTLKLHSAQEVARAKQVLQAARGEMAAALRGAPPLALRGLEYMNDDPSAVDVLYARCEAGAAHDALQAAWRALTARLSDAGLLPPDELKADLAGKLKFHATLVNTRWRRGGERGGGGGGGGGGRASIDARGLLESHGEFDFGAEAMSEVHLSRLAGPVDKVTGYYFAEAKVQFS